MVPDSEESAYSTALLDQVHHITVSSSEEHKDIFQKESLMNHGWRAALERYPYEYFIFNDADIYSEQSDWFRQIREQLECNPAAAVQGYRFVRDTEDDSIHFSSVAAFYALDDRSDLGLNPGLCWALSRHALEAGDGFNADCLDCAGDSAFVTEYLSSASFQYNRCLNEFRWFQEICRDLPFRLELECVPVDIVHVHHGCFEDRRYNEIRYAIEGLRPIKSLVSRDENGLLYWQDEHCTERKIMQHNREMTDKEAIDRLFSRFEYSRSQPTQVSQNVPFNVEFSDKPLLSPPAVKRSFQPEAFHLKKLLDKKWKTGTSQCSTLQKRFDRSLLLLGAPALNLLQKSIKRLYRTGEACLSCC